MKKIYIVTIDWANDGEFGNEIHGAYKNYEKAQAAFQTVVEREKTNWDGEDENIVIEQIGSCWEAYVDGYYYDHHTIVNITETEVE